MSDLQATLDVTPTAVHTADDLRARVVVTNTSAHPVKLSTLFFGFTPIMIKVRRADGTPVHPGPPPFPPADDGKEGRVVIPPGGAETFVYKGSNYFATPVPPGHYEVRFRYENTITTHGDWTGVLESAWVPFEVRP